MSIEEGKPLILNFFHYTKELFPFRLKPKVNRSPIEIDDNQLYLTVFGFANDTVSFGLYTADRQFPSKTVTVNSLGNIEVRTMDTEPETEPTPADVDKPSMPEPIFTSSDEEIISKVFAHLKKKFADPNQLASPNKDELNSYTNKIGPGEKNLKKSLAAEKKATESRYEVRAKREMDSVEKAYNKKAADPLEIARTEYLQRYEIIKTIRALAVADGFNAEKLQDGDTVVDKHGRLTRFTMLVDPAEAKEKRKSGNVWYEYDARKPNPKAGPTMIMRNESPVDDPDMPMSGENVLEYSEKESRWFKP